MKRKKPRFHRGLIRPVVYKAFTRVGIGLAAALLWNEFVGKGQRGMRGWAFLFLAVLFAAAAWMSYLRLDGVRAPQFDRKLFDWKRKPKRTYGDMIDYVNEDVPTFDDLEEDEQSLCLMVANAVCCAIFLVGSMI